MDGSVAVVSCLQKMAKHIFKPIYNNRLYNKSNEVMRFFLHKQRLDVFFFFVEISIRHTEPVCKKLILYL